MSDLAIIFFPALFILFFLLIVMLFVKISRDVVYGVYVFIFLASITEMPHLPVVGDRLSVSDFVMIFTLLVATTKGVLFSKAPKPLILIDQFALVFILLASFSSVISLIFSENPNPERSFLFMMIYIYGYLCFRLIIRVVNDKEKLFRVFLYWAAGAALLTIVGFLAATGIYKPAWTYDPIIMRINSTMKSSGQVSSYLAPAMFIFIFMSVNKWLSFSKRSMMIFLSAAAVVVMMGTGSRISFVILIFTLFYGVFTVLTTRGASVRRSLLIISLFVSVWGFTGYVVSVWTDTSEAYGLTTTSPFERAIKIFSDNSRENADASEVGGTRYDEISTAFENFHKAPLFGVGSGMFSSAYSLNEIHNTYVSILAENGLFSLISFSIWWLLMFSFVYRSGYASKGDNKLMLKLALGGLLALAVYQLTTNGMRQRPFWFIPALAVASAVVLRQPPQTEGTLISGKQYR
ncbi:O-antigen ligase family protein [Vibrio coralliirubri]|uniref:O-antigen ligase family protein n=1 Tax=Vibrio coralliirubri TaxID=1516159 RepID=UPI000634AD86|nr:O-antigen ligase family protein [Vibrio coralliirubri]CDU13618.1 membrane hypothetical protein [Vibrio coralliirubri]